MTTIRGLTQDQSSVLVKEIAPPPTGDPLGRGYESMSDAEVSEDMETEYRDAAAEPKAVYRYVAVNVAGSYPTETKTVIYGRLDRICRADIGAQVFGAEGPALTAEGLDACLTLLEVIKQDLKGLVSAVTTDPEIQGHLQLAVNMGAMEQHQIDEIKALSQNKLKRSTELQLPTVKPWQVTEARVLIQQKSG